MNDKESSLEQVTKEHSSMTKRFLFEMEKKKAELEVSKTHLRDAINTADRAISDRNIASAEAEKATKANLFNEDHLKRLLRDRDEQISDILSKSNTQLKTTREHYETEKHRFLNEIDELKKSRIELQVEIGHLMREKRKLELDFHEKVDSFFFNVLHVCIRKSILKRFMFNFLKNKFDCINYS